MLRSARESAAGYWGSRGRSRLPAAVIMGRKRSALRAYALQCDDPAARLGMLDRKLQYFEPDAMATVLFGVYQPDSGQLTASAGHLPPVLTVPGQPSGPVELDAGPPIRVADNPTRAAPPVKAVNRGPRVPGPHT